MCYKDAGLRAGLQTRLDPFRISCSVCFCALRPSEIRRLTWDDIDIVNKQIDIHSDKTKTRARRTVDIPENAASWLELCQITGKTELAPPRRALDALKRAGGYQGRVFRFQVEEPGENG